MMDDNELAAGLKIFLNNHKNDKNFFSRTQVGKEIEKFCRMRDNFKAAGRGNPSKGGRIKHQNFLKEEARKNGYDIEDEPKPDDYRE